MTNNKSYPKRFLLDNLYSLVMTIHEQYYIRNELVKNKQIDIVRNNSPYFIDSILYSLENGLFSDLAVLFSSSESNQISFYKILNLFDEKDRKPIEEKIKNNKVISKIFSWRNKNKGGHKDIKTLENPEAFERKYKLKFSDIENVLNFSREVFYDIEYIAKKEKNPFIINGFLDDLKSEIKSVVEKLSK